MQDESNKVHLIETEVDTFARLPFFIQNSGAPQPHSLYLERRL